jgi:curved DNA-binding protein CbpA
MGPDTKKTDEFTSLVLQANQPNFYDRLGVAQTAGDDAIRKAFRRLSSQIYPDLRPPSEQPRALAAQSKLGEAYEILKDPAKRAEYDSSLKTAQATKQANRSRHEPTFDLDLGSLARQAVRDFREHYRNQLCDEVLKRHGIRPTTAAVVQWLRSPFRALSSTTTLTAVLSASFERWLITDEKVTEDPQILSMLRGRFMRTTGLDAPLRELRKTLKKHGVWEDPAFNGPGIAHEVCKQSITYMANLIERGAKSVLFPGVLHFREQFSLRRNQMLAAGYLTSEQIRTSPQIVSAMIKLTSAYETRVRRQPFLVTLEVLTDNLVRFLHNNELAIPLEQREALSKAYAEKLFTFLPSPSADRKLSEGADNTNSRISRLLTISKDEMQLDVKRHLDELRRQRDAKNSLVQRDKR